MVSSHVDNSHSFSLVRFAPVSINYSQELVDPRVKLLDGGALKSGERFLLNFSEVLSFPK